jgi:hypothetical protein
MTGISQIPSGLPKQDEDSRKEEYLAILAVFERFLDSLPSHTQAWDVLEELMGLRAEFAIQHAIKGFDMEYDKALELVRTAEEGLTEAEKARRDILVAAIDNLVDFAVAEEYQMVIEMENSGYEDDDAPEEYDDDDEEEEEEDDDDDDDDDDRGVMVAICKRFNSRYAHVENMDIEYAMMVAAGLVAVSSRTVLTYMTQGDERVRPWHLQYEGFSAPKASFPAWLIPPMEHQCRCYLEEDVTAAAMGVTATIIRLPEMPDWFNPTFKESVALGGRIFSDEHPYFDIRAEHVTVLTDISNRIKKKYLTND